MHQMLKKTVLLFALLAFGLGVRAQKFKTHAVKSGETLTGISKQYGVSKAAILKYNKEIGENAPLKANTILVIPEATNSTNAAVQATKERVDRLISSVINDSVVPRKPVGFLTHKVKKRETIYGIAQRYKITEDELKKANPVLYATPLGRKMELRIPKYEVPQPELVENAIDPEDYEKYTVAPKETRWSIAHKYGISLDSMITLNPDLAKTGSYLAEGQVLLLPKIAGSSVGDQQTQLYTSYTVPAKMNFYRLEKEFGVASDEIIRLNPEITELGGLKEGMVIRIPEKKTGTGEINTENYLFYEVKPKQNEFRLTRKFGLSWRELVALNPELKDGLKAGMVLKLPKGQVGDFEVRNSLILDKISLLDSINVQNRPKVLFMLPFRLNLLDMANKTSVASTINRRRSLQFSLGVYSGALVALDSIKSLGVSVDVKVLDNELSLERTKALLAAEKLWDYHAVVGPVDANSLKEVSVQAARHKVPVLSPGSAQSNISLGNVFFSYTAAPVLRERMLAYVEAQREEQNVLIIADGEHNDVAAEIMAKFPDAKRISVKEEDKNIGINRDKLAAMLSKDHENWVFVETENFQLISSVVSILNAFHDTALDVEKNPQGEKIQVRMFTTDKNDSFENDILSATHLSNLNFTYPSVFREVPNNSFVKRYQKRFGSEPDRYAVWGFDLTMDLLLKLAYKNDLMAVNRTIGATEYNGSRFNYEKDTTSGYFNTAAYIMAYENMRIKQLD
ncbi:LysM peptidoglycan-binding domain-containing protein [Maribacter sp. 2307ULW6-5]|uniref:LysM peptidoglycan-binding domain-containing protein n=1 Tax=Maribacter sp. 2307ULW6-5 TaxID=3386275 RepID=UPI0039BC66DC